MSVLKTVKKLCSPARFYLGLSIFMLLSMIVQNLFNNNSKELCVGSYKCDIPSLAVFFGLETLYIVFWTWILNNLCRYGLKSVSWFLVLLPFLLFAVALALLVYFDIKNKGKATVHMNPAGFAKGSEVH